MESTPQYDNSYPERLPTPQRVMLAILALVWAAALVFLLLYPSLRR